MYSLFDVIVYRPTRENGRNNAQPCWELLFRQMLDVVGRDVVVGLAVVLLWSANGCNNFAISRPGWARKLTILRANTSDGDI